MPDIQNIIAGLLDREFVPSGHYTGAKKLLFEYCDLVDKDKTLDFMQKMLEVLAECEAEDGTYDFPQSLAILEEGKTRYPQYFTTEAYEKIVKAMKDEVRPIQEQNKPNLSNSNDAGKESTPNAEMVKVVENPVPVTVELPSLETEKPKECTSVTDNPLSVERPEPETDKSKEPALVTDHLPTAKMSDLENNRTKDTNDDLTSKEPIPSKEVMANESATEPAKESAPTTNGPNTIGTPNL